MTASITRDVNASLRSDSCQNFSVLREDLSHEELCIRGDATNMLECVVKHTAEDNFSEGRLCSFIFSLIDPDEIMFVIHFASKGRFHTSV